MTSPLDLGELERLLAEGWINVNIVPMLPQGAVELRREGDSLFYRSLTNEAMPVQSDAPAEQGDRMGTHSAVCWSFGPRHYECALNEIERLAALQAAPADPVAGVDAYRMRGIIDAATHAVLPLACDTTDTTGAGIRERAAMQVEIADRIQAELAAQAPSPSVEKLVGALEEVRDFIDRYSDVNDGDYGGQEPNAAMQIVHAIDEALAQAKGSGS